MRIAFFSDVHANLLALEAVLGKFQQSEHLPPWPQIRQPPPGSQE
jgi:hypothetical protein